MIDTEPGAGTSVDAGDEITINVSVGPEQREIPDVATLSYADAVKKLTDAGFGRFKQSPSASTPELKDRVVGTLPPANQTSAITNEITIVVGSGPEAKPVPDVKDQAEDSARQILTASGFTNLVPVPVDNTAPCGQVIGTDPAAGQQFRSTRRSRCSSRGATSSPCPTCGDSSGPTPSRGCVRWVGPADSTGAPTSRTAANGPMRW